MIIAKVMDAEPGMEVYEPYCGSGGLLIKCETALEEKETDEALRNILKRQGEGK